MPVRSARAGEPRVMIWPTASWPNRRGMEKGDATGETMCVVAIDSRYLYANEESIDRRVGKGFRSDEEGVPGVVKTTTLPSSILRSDF